MKHTRFITKTVLLIIMTTFVFSVSQARDQDKTVDGSNYRFLNKVQTLVDDTYHVQFRLYLRDGKDFVARDMQVVEVNSKTDNDDGDRVISQPENDGGDVQEIVKCGIKEPITNEDGFTNSWVCITGNHYKDNCDPDCN